MTDNLDVQPTAPTTDAPEAETEIATTETDAPEGEDAPDAPKLEEDVPFPKKAVNALTRRDRQIGKLRAEQQQLMAELAQLRSASQTSKPQANNVPADYPNEDNYETYGAYLKDVARYEARQELAEGSRKQQEQAQSQQEQAWIAQREDEITELAQTAIANVPDFQQIMTEHADIVDSFPPHLERLFLEVENPPMAFYALAKEGKLESLFQMTPYRAAMEIARAQDRGIALSQRKPITNAPKPIAGAKGLGASGKSLSDMSPAEMLKHLNIS